MILGTVKFRRYSALSYHENTPPPRLARPKMLPHLRSLWNTPRNSPSSISALAPERTGSSEALWPNRLRGKKRWGGQKLEARGGVINRQFPFKSCLYAGWRGRAISRLTVILRPGGAGKALSRLRQAGGEGGRVLSLAGNERVVIFGAFALPLEL